MEKSNKIVIYQVFPRLFGNDNDTCVKNGTLQQNGSGKFSDFTHEALKAISELGVTHIWYTGVIEHATKTDYTRFGIRPDHPAVVKGNAGSPYAIKDYYDVDPDLAENVPDRMAEFEAMLTRTHREGLKVIIDFVPNHVAREYYSDMKPAGVRDLGEEDKTSIGFSNQNNFYYITQSGFSPQFLLSDDPVNGYSEYPAKATGNDVFHASPSLSDWYETVKLNYGVDYVNGGTKEFDPIPDTWNKMYDILIYWVDKGVDGFRCDMAEMVPVEFWEWVIPKVKEHVPEVIFIAEIYNPQRYREFLSTGQFDYLYDKVGLYDTLRGVTCCNRSASDITECWKSIEGIQPYMLNFMENHDEQRIASDFFAHNGKAGIPGMVVSATMNVNPVMLYYGQELGERGMDDEGFSGVDGRTTIFDYWSVASVRNWRNGGQFNDEKLSDEERRLRGYYKKLLNLCVSQPAIASGQFFDLMYVNQNNDQFNPHRQYAYLRYEGEDVLLICVNFDANAVRVGVNLPAHAFDCSGLKACDNCEMTDLLTGEKMWSPLLPDHRVFFDLGPYGARILKL
ncbi:MAG: alpha-amylase family glycosyl hydrolase [Bacteroidales bacterium]|nr:alpha-amylase family glycosyl hydrolase [Bacteroidales bacterium]